MDTNNTNNKPYDLTTIYAISDDNAEFLEQLLIVFTDTVSQDVSSIKIAAAENNWGEVAQLAHKIKPSLTHFGINSLKEVINGLEHYQNSNQESLKAMVNLLDVVMNDVLTNLRAEFPVVFNK
jgi:HPt (histidine-containing phosphotransfer) domain-containing protein